MKSTTLTASFSLTAPQISVKPEAHGSKLRVVFFGTPEFATSFLKGLFQDPYFDVVAVVTQPDERVGRKKLLTAPPVKLLAKTHDMPIFQPTRLRDESFSQTLKTLKADLFVVVAYGRILPDGLLSLPPLGTVNVHPSLLPKWRGPSPKQAAIAHGDTETGVSIMKIDAEMDHGPILAQEKFPLDQNETLFSLTEKVVKIGVPLLTKTLKAYCEGNVQPVEQNHELATYCSLLKREDGVITGNEPADVIERKVRAYNPWPGTSTVLKGTDHELQVKIFAAAIRDTNTPNIHPGETLVWEQKLFLGTRTRPLEILELQPTGGKRMNAQDFIRGYLSPKSRS